MIYTVPVINTYLVQVVLLMKAQTLGTTFIIVAMLLFAANGIFVRFIPASVLTILFFNQLFGAIFFFALAFRKKQLQLKGMLVFFIFLGIAGALNDFSFYHAFRLTTIANAVLAHYTAPIFVALFAPLLLKERITRKTLSALALAIVGLVLILLPSRFSLDTNMIGIIAGLVSGFMYGFVILFYKKTTSHVTVFTANFYRYTIASLLVLPFLLIEGPTLTLNLLGLLALLAVTVAIIATGFHAGGIQRLKAQHAGVIGYIEPLAAALYAVVLFAEVPTVATIVGGALIIASTYLVLRDT